MLFAVFRQKDLPSAPLAGFVANDTVCMFLHCLCIVAHCQSWWLLLAVVFCFVTKPKIYQSQQSHKSQKAKKPKSQKAKKPKSQRSIEGQKTKKPQKPQKAKAKKPKKPKKHRRPKNQEATEAAEGKSQECGKTKEKNNKKDPINIIYRSI